MADTPPYESVCIYIAHVLVDRADGPTKIYCFVPAPSESAADVRLREALASRNLKYKATEFIKSYWDYEWDTKKLQKQYDRLAEEAYKSREVTIADLDA